MWFPPLRVRDVLWSFLREPFRREPTLTEVEIERLRSDMLTWKTRALASEATLAGCEERWAEVLGFPPGTDHGTLLDAAHRLVERSRRDVRVYNTSGLIRRS